MNRFYKRIFMGMVISSFAVLGISLSGCGSDKNTLTASGTLEAVQVKIPARSSGVLEEVVPREGVLVSQGDVLARIDDRALLAARDQARAGLVAAEASLEILETGARREDIAQAEDSLVQARENFKRAREDADRVRNLQSSGSVSQQQLDEAEARLVVSRAQLSSAQASRDKLVSGARSEELKMAVAARDKARSALNLTEANLSDTVIRSPLDGTVLYRLAEPGEWVGPGMSLFVLADLSRLELTVYLPEPELPNIRLGERAELRFDGTRKSAGATVSWISPVAEFTPKNVQTRDERVKQVFAVRLIVPNPEGRFHPGMPADAVFSNAENDNEAGGNSDTEPAS